MAGIVLQMDAPILAEEMTGRGLAVHPGVRACSGSWPWSHPARGVGRDPRAGRRRGRAVIWGWGVAQYPDILPGTMTLAEAAAPAGSLGALLVVFVVAALVIAPSLALLYYLDQASRLGGHGAATSPQGDRPAGRGR